MKTRFYGVNTQIIQVLKFLLSKFEFEIFGKNVDDFLLTSEDATTLGGHFAVPVNTYIS